MTDAERQTVESIRSRIRKWDRHEVDKDSYYALGVDGAVSDAAVLLDLLDEAIASANTDAAPEGTASAWIEQSARSSERTNAECSSKPIARHRSGADYSRLTEIRARLDAATPGQPWVVVHETFVEPHAHILVGNEEWQDAITHAPADIAFLLAENEALREQIVFLRKEVRDAGRSLSRRFATRAERDAALVAWRERHA